MRLRRYNRARVAGFEAWVKGSQDISEDDKDAILMRCRWSPKRVDEELEAQMRTARRKNLYGMGEEPGERAGETDWEKFFDGLSNFAKEVLPLILTICAA